MRLVTDVFSYCAAELPSWNTISISGYHMREAGATAAQELAFTIANGLAYVEAAIDAGLDVDRFAPRLSFFWNAHSQFFEEVAKYRAARRMWAGLMRDRVGATDPKSWQMRFHTQTAGSSLTAQQPELNIVRTAVEALSAVLGGTQSLHTNSFDEALGLPTEKAAKIALKTQQILAFEAGVAETVDPLAGSYFVEALTDALEAQVRVLLSEVDALGGAVKAIEAGFPQSAIEDAAYETARRIESGDQKVVAVNAFTEEGEEEKIPVLRVDASIQREQTLRLARLRARRDGDRVETLLDAVRETATTGGNLLYPMKEALRAEATLGEVSDALRDVFGEYRP
jgi:methylmalonyl-CoA mutase N-terminal domain/subunit